MKKTPTHLVYSTKKVAQQREKERTAGGEGETQSPCQRTTPRVATTGDLQKDTMTTTCDSPEPSRLRADIANLLSVTTNTTASTGNDDVNITTPPTSRRNSGTSNSNRSSSDSGRHRSHSISTSKSHRLDERSVKRLRPSPALLQSDRITVAQCVKTMVEKKAEATLLVDKNGLLTGILTDRDIAVKVVALGRNPKFTRVRDVMTPNPHCVASNASALDALKKMVSGQFRHLPVADNDKVVGILDIAKCLYEAITKVEHEYNVHSKKLSAIIEQLEKRMPGQSGENLFDRLREKLFLPTLSAILLERSPVPVLRPNANAFDAAMVMLNNKTSAVMVCDTTDHMVGIFTSKDLMRRVVGADLDPTLCVLSKVMTANPFSARLNTTILETLHSMHNGRFLHVPVFDEESKLVGLVDVLQATCAIVQQMGTFQLAKTDSMQPLWKQMQKSFIQTEDVNDGDDDDVEPPMLHDSDQRLDTSEQSTSGHDEPTWSESLDLENRSVSDVDPAVERPPPDVFVYKLADWNGTNHRFTSSAESVKELLRDVQTRLGDNTIRKVHYVDDEEDHVLLFKDDDLKDAVLRARTWGRKYIRLIVLHRVASRGRGVNSSRALRSHHNDSALGIVYYAAAAAAIAGASFLLSRRR